MGLDLTLLPYDGRNEDWAASFTVLQCERRSGLFAAIGDVETARATPVPKSFNSYLSRDDDNSAHYTDSHYGNTQETPYGDPVHTLTAGELSRAFHDHEDVQDNALNRATWAYLANLPPDTRVALYWH